MPLIQNPPNKRFGLSRYWTQKRPMQNGGSLFLIRKRYMPNGGTLFLIRRGSMQKGGILFLNQKELVPNGGNLFLNQKRLAPNGGILFLNQKRLVQNEGNGYGLKKWRLYLYWYPIWHTASSTANWSAVRWTKKTYSSACVSIKPSFKSCLLSAAS